jgi:hypothetical protein
MFSRCASGSCDFVLFSAGEQAWIVEDIALIWKSDKLLREKRDSLLEGLKLRESISEMGIDGSCCQD